MTTKLGIEIIELKPSVNHNRWGGYPARAWELNSQALLVSVGDTGMILEHVGAHIDYEVSEMSACIEDAGLVPEEDGIWIWEGKYRVTCSDYPDGREYDSEPVGEFRRLTRDELELLAAGKPVLKEQPLNPDFCERVAKAVEENNVKAIGEAFDVCLSEDLRHDDIYVLFAEACNWEANSESRERFKQLWLSVARAEMSVGDGR